MANVDNSPFPVEESDLKAAEISCHPEKRASQSPDFICPGFGACRTLLQDSLADGNKASLGFAGAQPIFNPNLDSLKSSPDVPNKYLKSVKRLRVFPQPRKEKKVHPDGSRHKRRESTTRVDPDAFRDSAYKVPPIKIVTSKAMIAYNSGNTAKIIVLLKRL